MRKIIIYVLGFVLICFTIPIIFTHRLEKNEIDMQNIENTIQENIGSEADTPYIYQKYGTVKLLHSQTGEVEELQMDEYLLRSSRC